MEEIYQLLQIGDQQKAAELLVDFLYQKFGLQARNLNFLQSAVSLNSFKGSFKVGQKRYFFKTHIEVGGEVAEYAGAKLLEKVGYPIIAPIFMCTERGRELLIYPWIEEPSLFEVVYEQGGQFDFVAQEALDKRLFEIYRKTFERGRYEYPAVQQLFYKRLCGSRFKNFYGDSDEFKEFAMMRWIVNGKDLGVLGDKLDIARQLLSPNAQQKFSIIGHGDAHNGNVFLGDNLRYFDPAYAGRMDPFLDLAKPIFHNTFARWMYFPEQVEAELDISIRFENG